MVNRLTFLLLIGLAATDSSIANAVPTLLYNPANGNLQLINDGKIQYNNTTYLPYFYIGVESLSGGLSAPKSGAIPGATIHLEELPTGIEFFNIPLGTFDLGNVATPGTPANDLKVTGVGAVLAEFPVTKGVVVIVPEPSAAVIGLACAVVAAMAIRSRRRLECGAWRGSYFALTGFC